MQQLGLQLELRILGSGSCPDWMPEEWGTHPRSPVGRLPSHLLQNPCLMEPISNDYSIKTSAINWYVGIDVPSTKALATEAYISLFSLVLPNTTQHTSALSGRKREFLQYGHHIDHILVILGQ